MVKFEFEINKEASFAYWLQTLINWSPHFQKRANQYYVDKLGELNHIETDALDKLKAFLKDSKNGYLWLYELYTGKTHADEDAVKEWDNIRNVFLNKFDIVWNEQVENLHKWKNLLCQQDFKLEEKLNKIAVFLNTSEVNRNFKVQLLIHWDPEKPSGHTHRNFPDTILLALSSVGFNRQGRVCGALLHEAIHHIEYVSPNLEKYILVAYRKYIKPAKFEIAGQKWKSLFIETIITSMAGGRYTNYFGKYFSSQKEMLNDTLELENFNFEEQKLNSGFLIRKASSLAITLTSEYLDSGKVVDQKYVDSIAKIWLNMAGTKQNWIKRFLGING